MITQTEQLTSSFPRSAPRRALARALARPSLGQVGFSVALLFAALAFWIFPALPFMDLPAHAGLIALRDRWADSHFDQQYYVLDPHVGPYSLFRFLGSAFAIVLGPLGAVRALATLPVVLTPLVLLYGRRKLHGDPRIAFGFLGIVLSFGLMTLLGFASYLLGVTALLFALVLWLDLLGDADTNTPRAAKEVKVAVAAPFVFVAHGHAFVLFLALAGVTALSAGRVRARALHWRALLPAIALAARTAWLERATKIPPGSAPLPGSELSLHFQGPVDKLSLLLTPSLFSRLGVDAVVCLLMWALVVVFLVAIVRAVRGEPDGGSLRHARALLACALAVLVVFALLPHSVGWFGFIDGRLVPLVFYLVFLGVPPRAVGKRLGRFVDAFGPMAAAAIVVLFHVASYRFQKEAAGYREVLALIPGESRVLNFPLDPNSDVFTAHPFIHYDKLVAVDRPMVASDLWFHQGTAVYPRPGNPVLKLPPSYIASDLTSVDWDAYDLTDWDYVLLRTRPSAALPGVPPTLMLAAHQGGWWLFKKR